MNVYEKEYHFLRSLFLNIVDDESAFDSLFLPYCSSNRYYHTPKHLTYCVKELFSVSHVVSSFNSLFLALLGHDVVYDVLRLDNESQSAAFCERVLGSFFQDTFVVRDLILVTDHKRIPRTFNEHIFVDIDLSILGSLKETFEWYERGVRKEYHCYSDLEYKRGRQKVLESFLDRDFIYYTSFFREKYEQKARDNITRSLSFLVEGNSTDSKG